MASAIGGTIKGHVRAEGKAGAEADASTGQYESRRFKHVERINYEELHEFVVYVDFTPPEKPKPPAEAIGIVTQKDATFAPHVLPVVVGTRVKWPNEDTIYHNVFSKSGRNAFDLDLYKAPVVKEVPFNYPGQVDVFCSIHSRMHCIVLVLENPWFARTDAHGDYVIEHVPAGTYHLKAWHERLPDKDQEVVVPEQGEIKVDFTLGITGLPKH